MNRKFMLIAAGLTAVGLLVVTILVLRGPDSVAHEDGDFPSREDMDAPFQSPGFFEGDQPDQVSLYQHYKRYFKYPPNSRPLEEEDESVVNFGTVPVEHMQVPFVNKEGKVEMSGYDCRIQPNQSRINAGEVQIVTLSCLNTASMERLNRGKRDPNAALRILEAKVEKADYNKMTLLPSTQLSYNDDGRDGDNTAGDNEVALIFKPVESDWGRMRMTVKFEAGSGADKRELELQTGFFSSPKSPALFTGNFFERLENGSLVIDVEMNVKKAGKYRVQGNLRNEDGYITVAKKEIKLQPGTVRVPLLFFGKIFHDKGADGPYSLVELQSYRDNHFIDDEILDAPNANELIREKMKKIHAGTAKVEPLDEFVPPYMAEFRTQEYRLSDFSDQEYDSEKKRETLERYSQVAQAR